MTEVLSEMLGKGIGEETPTGGEGRKVGGIDGADNEPLESGGVGKPENRAGLRGVGLLLEPSCNSIDLFVGD